MGSLRVRSQLGICACDALFAKLVEKDAAWFEAKRLISKRASFNFKYNYCDKKDYRNGWLLGGVFKGRQDAGGGLCGCQARGFGTSGRAFSMFCAAVRGQRAMRSPQSMHRSE